MTIGTNEAEINESLLDGVYHGLCLHVHRRSRWLCNCCVCIQETRLSGFKLTPPKPKSETEIRNEILGYLVKKNYFPLKYKNMGVFDPVRKIYLKDNSRYFIKGAFDLVAGKPECALSDVLWIETKTEAEMKYIVKHRADIEAGKGIRVKRRFHIWEQIQFEKTITRAWGCRAFFAGSVRDVAAVICPEDLGWLR